MDLSIIIVNWNVRDLLRRCLASIQAHQGDLSLEVIVVDSASQDGSAQMVEREFPQVHLLASRDNLGYTGGNNLGAQKAQGRYLLILNSDTEIVQDALQQLIAYLDTHPTIGVVGPQLLYPDGSTQSSRRRFPNLAIGFLAGTPLGTQRFGDDKRMRWYYMADQQDDVVQPVDWLVGAALMIRRQAWEQVGPLDSRFFMYSEELDWCRRCRDTGWDIHYLPSAQIIHHEQASSKQVGATTWMRTYRSRIIYFDKYYGPVWAAAIRLFLSANFAYLLAVESAFWLIGRRPESRRQRMHDYRQVLAGLW